VSIHTFIPALQQVTPVRLVHKAATGASEPWPMGYTMTVWGVAIGLTVLCAVAVSAWMRMSSDARALVVQTVYWRLSPRQLLVLRAAAQASGTPASTLLVSRGAFESAMAAWAERAGDDGGITVATRRSLATLAGKVFGPMHSGQG